MMKTKTEEVAELVILTDEQIEVLPESVKENVVFLTEQLHKKDLMVLNPIVSELIEIRSFGDRLEMKPPKDGVFDKDNVQEFIDLKKKIRTFRAGVKKSGTDLKEPYLKIQKGVVAIEKAIIEEATKVYDDAEVKFKLYIDAEEEKARLKEEAKNKALLDAVEEQSKAAKEAEDKLKVSQVYNKIKYDIITKSIVENVNDALLNANEARLRELSQELNQSSYDGLVSGIDISVLSQEVAAELHEFYSISKNRSIKLINEKLKAIDIEKQNMLLENAKSSETSIDRLVEAKNKIDAEIPPAVPPVPGMESIEPFSDALASLDDDQFIGFIIKEANKLLYLTNARLQKKPHCSPRIYDIRNLLSKFKI